MAYAGLIMIGNTSVSDDCPTARTNGKDKIYGRAYVDSLMDAELRFLIMHEVKHCLYQHLFIWKKLFEEDADLANRAADYVVNLELKDLDPYNGFLLMPKGGLCDEMYRGLDSGQVFARLKQDKKDGKGNGAGKPLDDHDYKGAQALSEAEKAELSKEIDSAVRTGALLAGKNGGEVDRGFEAVMQAQVNWAEQLREFVSSVCVGKGDSTWAKPSRRWLQHDIYMPSQISESIGSICVGIDTSGSIGSTEIAKALSELVSICDNNQPEKVDLLYWDSQVASHEQYREGDYDGLVTSTRVKGGGGTDVACVFDYIKDNKLDPVVCIVITDGYTPYPTNPPPYPVLWVMVDNKHTQPPFGTTIRIT